MSSKKISLEKKIQNLAEVFGFLTAAVKSEGKKAKIKRTDWLAEKRPLVVEMIGVDWLNDWIFPFDGLDAIGMMDKKSHIESLANMALSVVNSQSTTQYRINFFRWITVQDSPLILQLQAFLDPPAQDGTAAGTGPKGTIQPDSPSGP